MRESSRYYNGLTLQHNLLRHAPDAADSLLARALAGQAAAHARSHLPAARPALPRRRRRRGALHASSRASAPPARPRVEYLDNLLGGVVRKRVLPILDDTPLAEKVRYANVVLKSRPRDLEDTLAQLVHDDDPVVAAAAIHFVGQRRRVGADRRPRVRRLASFRGRASSSKRRRGRWRPGMPMAH